MDSNAQPILPTAPVTLLDIYTQQIRIDGKLDLIQKDLEKIPDHEARIRVLEAARGKLIGAAITVSAAVSAFGYWIGYALTRH